MGHNDHYRHHEYSGNYRPYLKILKKNLRLFGCGCVGITIILSASFLIVGVAGIKNWIMPAMSELASRLPKEIPLPEGFGIPALPTGLLKLTPQEQIQLGREVARQEGMDQNSFSDPAIDAVAERLVKALRISIAGRRAADGNGDSRVCVPRKGS
jgi:hypothetical protein